MSQVTHSDYLNLEPFDFEIKELSGGGRHIPILSLENSLDMFRWGTRSYVWQIYKDGYANLCVAASIELVLNFIDDSGVAMVRTFIGACNFPLKSIEPIQDWNATAKSMCIKNAASDAGKKLGRGLNEDVVPARTPAEKPEVKLKPDSKIMQKFLAAIEAGDQATQTMLSNIYDIKSEPDAEEK